MKKAYAKPTATKVDFEYKDQVIAQSGGEPIGTEARPSHSQYCQYKQGGYCNFVYNAEHNCENYMPSLNL